MTQHSKHTSWKMIDEGFPDYLDGVRSQFTIKSNLGRNIAYTFEKEDAILIASAPRMAKRIEELEALLERAIYWIGWKPETEERHQEMFKLREQCEQALNPQEQI